MKITISTPIAETPRVLQVRGLFDLPATTISQVEWDIDLPLHEKAWNVGLIVGPSGCGKTTLARALWRTRPLTASWPTDRCILDGFPEQTSIKELTEILCSVGFASPTAWLRPFHVLSTGQQFRANLARLIATSALASEPRLPLVVDEFTSVVDRTVARLGSAALARTIRARSFQFVAISCHEDIEAWLQPDWVFRPAEQQFTWRSLQRRPALDLRIVRCRPSAWPLFAPHHYLNGALARNGTCFLAYWGARPVAFSAWLPFFGPGPLTRREHRTVTLPDFQGVGVGNALSATIASMWKALSYRAVSTTSHPALMRARCASPLWRMHRPPSFGNGGDQRRHAGARLTAGFTYVGPAMNLQQAKGLCQ